VTVEAAIADHLAADAGVTALVAQRVYQLILPQKPTLPAVRVQLVDDVEGYHLRGGSELKRARVQTDAYAVSYTVATQVAAAIHTALSGRIFSVGSPAFEVTATFRADRRVLYEAGELRLQRVLQDYIVWYRS
jgi:hypothetical protein